MYGSGFELSYFTSSTTGKQDERLAWKRVHPIISIIDSLNLDGGKDRIVDSRLARYSVPQPVQGVATVGLSRGKES